MKKEVYLQAIYSTLLFEAYINRNKKSKTTKSVILLKSYINMKKITLLLSLLFCIIGIGKTFAASPITSVTGTTKITAATALDVTKVYMIFSSDGTNARGVLCCTADGNNLTRCAAAGQTSTANKNDAYQQFVFVPYLGKYYLYNVGKKKFCKDVGDTAEMTDAVGEAQHVTVTAGTVSGTFMIKFNGTDQIGLSNQNNTGVYPSTNAGNDEGTRLYIAAVDGVTFTTDQFNEAWNKLLNMKSATLYPQDGKAYRIKARYNSTTTEFRYLYEGDSRISLSSTTKTDNTDIFICRVTDGTYSFVTNNGKWLVYYADGKNGAGSTTNGLAATYELGTYDATWTLSENLNPTNTSLSTTGAKQLNLYGTVRMQGRNTTDNGNYYLMAGATNESSSDGNFHNGEATVTYFTNTRSSFFVFEEVTDYPNKPTMTACDNIETGKKIATFSAKFPTIVPEGLSAYIISSNSTQSAHMEAIAGAGEVIPANTGVLLFGETAETKVTMKPATTEGTGNSVGTNLLAHSAGESISFEETNNAYILASGNSGIAFYACSGGTLAMNKSYLQISGGSTDGTNGKAFTLTLGGESTGLQTIGNDLWNNNAPIYDLSGRRVMHPAKGGVYIQNGRKFINK